MFQTPWMTKKNNGGLENEMVDDVRRFTYQVSVGHLLIKNKSLEPQTTILYWMFVETTISYVKIWNHQIETTIYKWMFGVPGVYSDEVRTFLSFSKS